MDDMNGVRFDGKQDSVHLAIGSAVQQFPYFALAHRRLRRKCTTFRVPRKSLDDRADTGTPPGRDVRGVRLQTPVNRTQVSLRLLLQSHAITHVLLFGIELVEKRIDVHAEAFLGLRQTARN